MLPDLRKVLLHLIALSTLCEVNGVRINPFTGFSETNYEPLSDFSINQGAYMPNMPLVGIYPKLHDDSFNTMIGLPSLNSQVLPFVNPLSPTLSQAPNSRPHHPRNKVKNTRNNNQRPLNGNTQQKQRNGPQKTRGVTLDIRGGGYKVEPKQNIRPYKAPIAESSVRNTQRQNSNRSPGANSARQNNSPPRNRKPNQRPRGPSMKNPHYNMKFETSLPSIPPNVEFVNPENVLPFHPRIYKQFLQHNKDFGAYFQNMNKRNPPKSKPPTNRPFGPSFQGNGYNPGKSPPSKPMRNRGNPMSSSLAQSSQFPSFASNFPGSQLPNTDINSQFGFQQKPNVGKLFNNPFDINFFNQDPNLFSSLSQTNEGRAILSQLQQQSQLGNQGNIPNTQPVRQQLNNKPSPNVYPNTKPSSFANSNPSFQGPVGSPVEAGIAPSFQNHFGGNQGIVQYDGSNAQSNVKSPNPEKEFQQMLLYYQQLQQQQQFQQPATPVKQFSLPSSNPSAPQSFPESSQPSSMPNYPPNQQQYSNTPIQTNPYNEYQFMQGSSYQDTHSQAPASQSSSFTKSTNAPYEDSRYSNSYQTNQDPVKSQITEIQNADQAGYTLPPFSPIDPLATAVEGSQQDIHDYYGYQQASTHHKSPLYSNEQIAQNGGSSGMHEISPYSDEKSSSDYGTSAESTSSTKAPNSEITSGYMTPEQLFAPHATGLQSEAKFGYPSAHGGLSHSQTSSSYSKDSSETEAAGSSVEEHHEGGERAALHLPEEVSIYVARQTENPYLYEYTEAYDPFLFEINDKMKTASDSSKQTEVKDHLNEAESDEKFNAKIREFQKLLTKAPKNSYMVEPNESLSLTTAVHTTSTTRIPVLKKASDAESEEMKNHKTTPSYMFQYAPAERPSTKAPAVWNAWKPNASRYHLPLPDFKPKLTTSTTTSTTTTTTTTTQAPPSSSPTPVSTPSSQNYYHEPETPICARFNNLTYCLQDPEYPKDEIKKAIEKNRHPLDHFLVDISASSNIVDDNLNKVFENSVPLQSTSISYSFEGKAIAPPTSNPNNGSDCISNVHYAKPLRAINTAGLWKIIVNVEFEETGANYTQTVRIEECSHTAGYVATCGTETISACLQQYKLYRLLAWEPHRGFYIDAFLLPISCFCGSQQSR
ncbi:uncharacterized protein TNIN_92291 [Trichonephila inaurata madagascariensis]|uniref:Spaetzle domain-containing protein n=1 Tax=Trichonephila inaurata madagascariensis TaxID=2747483 RepID=A0A8X6YT95_9ARAC|nr:uncharacterized protein TNIN_92291 [Trichonephila inaurata madagascariensis]